MAHTQPDKVGIRVKAVLASGREDTISVEVVSDPAASFDCASVQEAVRRLINRHSNADGVSEVVLWNRLAPDCIDDIVACLNDLGCEVLSEHEEHVRFRVSRA